MESKSKLGFLCLLAVSCIATITEALPLEQESPSKSEKVEPTNPPVHLPPSRRPTKIDDGGLLPVERQKRTLGKWLGMGHGGGGCGYGCGGGGGGYATYPAKVIEFTVVKGHGGGGGGWGNTGGYYPSGGGCGYGGCGGGGGGGCGHGGCGGGPVQIYPHYPSGGGGGSCSNCGGGGGGGSYSHAESSASSSSGSWGYGKK